MGSARGAGRVSAFFTENPLDEREVTIGTKRLERLERVEAAAAHVVALMEAESRAQAAGQIDGNASPSSEAPPRKAFLDAYKALREAVRS